MDWNKVWEIVLTCVASAGGVAVIALATVKFSANILKTHLEKKISVKFDKELEAFKSELGRKAYVSQARFDKEFKIIEIMSEKVQSAVYDCCVLYPGLDYLPEDVEERKKIYKDRYRTAVSSFNDAQMTLNTNASFVPKEVYEKFNDVLKDCKSILITFEIYGYAGSDDEVEARKQRRQAASLGRALLEKLENLRDELREYLYHLDVEK